MYTPLLAYFTGTMIHIFGELPYKNDEERKESYHREAYFAKVTLSRYSCADTVIIIISLCDDHIVI